MLTRPKQQEPEVYSSGHKSAQNESCKRNLGTTGRSFGSRDLLRTFPNSRSFLSPVLCRERGNEPTGDLPKPRRIHCPGRHCDFSGCGKALLTTTFGQTFSFAYFQSGKSFFSDCWLMFAKVSLLSAYDAIDWLNYLFQASFEPTSTSHILASWHFTSLISTIFAMNLATSEFGYLADLQPVWSTMQRFENKEVCADQPANLPTCHIEAF